jgi:hypothetical protein
MAELITEPITWYVALGDELSYRSSGAKNVIEAGNVCQARNRALEDAFNQGKICIQLSDDLKNINLKTGETVEKISFNNAITYMIDSLDRTTYTLCGVSPTANPYFSHKEYSYHNFVIGDFIAVKPCPLRFDENIFLKEDYDYTLQHIKCFGGALRCNFLLPEFKHYTNKGGAVTIRTAEVEQIIINRLKAKWGNAIIDNPKRANEILLRASKIPKERKLDSFFHL